MKLRYLLPTVLAGLCIASNVMAEDCCQGNCYTTWPLAPFAVSVANQERWHDENYQRDQKPVRDWVYSKRTIPLEEKACNLTLAGDVRFKYAHLYEKERGYCLRGSDAFVPGYSDEVVPSTGPNDPAGEWTEFLIAMGDTTAGGRPRDLLGNPWSTSVFEVVLNLYVDYVCDRSWGVAWVEFANVGGVKQHNKTCMQDCCGPFGSGTFDGLLLRKAYFGYNICVDGESRLDIEIGRRPLWTVFDSRVQFQSNMDGILLRYFTSGCAGLGSDLYVNAAGFVVDEKAQHYAWIVEAGMYNLFDCNLDIKYSYIDWVKPNASDNRKNRCGCVRADGWNFRNSQLTFEYTIEADWMCSKAMAYGAVLYNHAADLIVGKNCTNSTTYEKQLFACNKENLAWYLGFLFGEVCGCGDWAIDINYQHVEAQAVADPEVGGIGRGNVLGRSFTQGITGGCSPAVYRGNANYQGWRFEALYAITDNLTADISLEYSKSEDSSIGPGYIYVNGVKGAEIAKNNHSYSKFQIDGIYAF